MNTVLNTENIDHVLSEAIEILNEGGVVAYPTESFYALGVIAINDRAVNKLFKLKKRPAEKPLPVIIGSLSNLESIVKNIPKKAETLIEKFWPGPLTLIFNAKDVVPPLLTGGTGKIAARIPGESIALHLAVKAGFPITATSANPSGKPPAENSVEVNKYFGNQVDLIIDSGKAPGGKPSTIIDVTVAPCKILRAGSIKIDDTDTDLDL